MADRDRVSDRALEQGFEPTDVSPARVALFGVGTLVTIALAGLLLWWLVGIFAGLTEHGPASWIERTELVPQPPQLQRQPTDELELYMARERGILTTYGWVDRDAGLVRVPIDEAMSLLAERGWPEQDGAERGEP